jgi:hypothetical protein
MYATLCKNPSIPTDLSLAQKMRSAAFLALFGVVIAAPIAQTPAVKGPAASGVAPSTVGGLRLDQFDLVEAFKPTYTPPNMGIDFSGPLAVTTPSPRSGSVA